MCSTLKQYHTITKVKAELDQFLEGLETMGVLCMTKQHSDVMKVFFVASDNTKLQRGELYMYIGVCKERMLVPYSGKFLKGKIFKNISVNMISKKYF